MKKCKILVTGAAGFIGSEFVRQMVNSELKIVVVDKLTYAGDLARLAQIKDRIVFYKTDINNKEKLDAIFLKEKPQRIVHFAAETHVDRSILDNRPFIETNILGTQNLIDLARKYKIEGFYPLMEDSSMNN